MRRMHLVSAILLGLLLGGTSRQVPAQNSSNEDRNPYTALPWESGPTKGRLGNEALLVIPEEYAFLPKSEVARFIELTQNVPSGREVAVLVPKNDDESWFVLFSFEEIGYVKDDEGRSLNPDALLQSFREGTETSNEERRKRGWATMEVVGWSTPPNYEVTGHHLEWGLTGRSHEPDGSTDLVTNHFVKVLGRGGVLTCKIIGPPEENESAVRQMRSLIGGLQFNPGRRYEEYIKGDKVAAVGLTGLIVGGAAAVAVKSGLFAKLIKPILLAAFAFLAAIGRGLMSFLRRLTGRSEGPPDGGVTG